VTAEIYRLDLVLLVECDLINMLTQAVVDADTNRGSIPDACNLRVASRQY